MAAAVAAVESDRECLVARVVPRAGLVEEGSPFVEGLTASLGGVGHVTRYLWSGGNTVWDRIWAAGAEVDFGMETKAGRPASLRDHIARIARDYPGAAQILVAHRHGGNVVPVCALAGRDAAQARVADAGRACRIAGASSTTASSRIPPRELSRRRK